MTTDQPITPRAALLAFADRIEQFDPLYATPARIADIARKAAADLPDVADDLERLSETDPPLNEAEVRRTHALHAAAVAYQGIGDATNDDIVLCARTFEAYLKGDAS